MNFTMLSMAVPSGEGHRPRVDCARMRARGGASHRTMAASRRRRRAREPAAGEHRCPQPACG